MTNEQKIIATKVGLLKLAEQLGTFHFACPNCAFARYGKQLLALIDLKFDNILFRGHVRFTFSIEPDFTSTYALYPR